MMRLGQASATLAFVVTLCALFPATPAAPSPKPTSATAPATAAAAPAGESTGELPHWVEPSEGKTVMRIQHDSDTLVITKFLSKGRSRTDMTVQGQAFTRLDLGDADETTITLMPEQKMAMKMSMKGMKGMPQAAEEAEPGAAPSPADMAGHVKRVGPETVNGRAAIKYRVDMDGETAYSWNDATTGAPIRMQSKDATIDWVEVSAEKPSEEMFKIPSGYQIMDMSQMRGMAGGAGSAELSALMGSMGGKMPGGAAALGGAMGGMGGMGGALGGAMGGMGGGVTGMAKSSLAQAGTKAASNYGGSLGATAGASLGGPLGAMAGQYIGSKVAGWIAGKAANHLMGGSGGPAAAPMPTGEAAPAKRR